MLVSIYLGVSIILGYPILSSIYRWDFHGFSLKKTIQLLGSLQFWNRPSTAAVTAAVAAARRRATPGNQIPKEEILHRLDGRKPS